MIASHMRSLPPLAAALLLTGCARTSEPPLQPPRVAFDRDVEEATAPSPADPTVSSAVPVAFDPTNADPTCDATVTCQGESCCTKLLVPGGHYQDARAGSVEVGTFYLDKYELSVGRVKRWVAAGRPVPADGALLGHDSGGKPITWSKAWPVQDDASLVGWERYDTWRTGRVDLPKNFLDWYTSAAVCAYAGGRLPSDAEWRYVAVGGEEARKFPWGSEPQTPERAVYNCMGDGNQSCSLADILPVGSRPKGAGRWGHQDLAGSMFEWTQDAGGSDETVNRGGGFCYIGGIDRRVDVAKSTENLRRDKPDVVSHMVGARCAFDVKEPGRALATR